MIWERIEPTPDSVRDHWSRLECRECVHFCAHAENPEHARRCARADHCRRIDHQRVRFYHPSWHHSACGGDSPYVCREFAPEPRVAPWLAAHWRGWDDYWGREVLELVRKDEYSFVPLVLAGEAWCYHVHLWDWWDGTHLDANGDLRWFERWRYPPHGRRVIWERREI